MARLSYDDALALKPTQRLSYEDAARLGDSGLAQFGQNVAEFGKGIPTGAVSMAGTAMQGASATIADAPRRQVEVWDRIDAGERVDPLEDPFGYRDMTPEQRQALRQRAAKDMAFPVTDRPLFRAGQRVAKGAQEMLPAAPGYEDSAGRVLGEGVGTVVAGAGVSAIPGVGAPLAAGTFALSGAGEAVQRYIEFAKSKGQPVDDETLIAAARGGVIPGMTDSIPIETLLGRIPVPGGKFVKMPAGAVGVGLRAIGRIGWQAFIEGVQEGGQEFLQNLVGREVYNPEQSLSEGVVPSAGAGAGVGALIEGIATPFRRGPGRVRSQPQQDVQPGGSEGGEVATTQPPIPQIKPPVPDTRPAMGEEVVEDEDGNPVGYLDPQTGAVRPLAGERLTYEQAAVLPPPVPEERPLDLPGGQGDETAPEGFRPVVDMTPDEFMAPVDRSVPPGVARETVLPPPVEPAEPLRFPAAPAQPEAPDARPVPAQPEETPFVPVPGYAGPTPNLAEPGGQVAKPGQVTAREAELDRLAERAAVPQGQVKPTPAAESAFNPAAHLPALSKYIRESREPLTPKAIARRLDITPDQAQQVLGAAAKTRDPGFRASKDGKFRRTPQRKGPVDLLTYVAMSGGIRDDEGHDLRNGRGLGRFIPGVGQLIRKDGANIDALGERLWEGGWFGPHAVTPRPTTAQVLDLLDEAGRGNLYHPDDQEAVVQQAAERDDAEYAVRLADARAELEAELRDLGVTGLPGDAMNDIADIMVGQGMDASRAFEVYMDGQVVDVADQAVEDAGDGEGFDIPFDQPAKSDRADGPDREGQPRAATDEVPGEVRRASAAQGGGREGPVDRVDTLDGFRDQQVIPGAEKKSRQEVRDQKQREKQAKAEDETRVRGAQSKMRRGGQKEADTTPLFGAGKSDDMVDSGSPVSDKPVVEREAADGETQGLAKPGDIDRQWLISAYSGVTMSPERRADSDIAGYVKDVNDFAAELLALAETDRQKAVAGEQAEKYRENYLKHARALWSATSRTLNWTVTGRGNFPVARNEKRQETERKRGQEFQEWYGRARAAARKAVADARSGEQVLRDEWKSLQAEVGGAMAAVKAVVDGNPSFRGYDPNSARQSISGKLHRLAANGETELVRRALEYIREKQAGWKKPFFAPRNAAWQLAERAEAKGAEQVAEAAEGPRVVAEYDGGTVERDAERVRIHFHTRPGPDIRNALKAEGWRWSPSNSAWQRKATNAAEESATRLMRKFFDIKASPARNRQTDTPADTATIASDLHARLKALGLSDKVALNIETRLFGKSGDRRIALEGAYAPHARLISVSLEGAAGDWTGTLNHEAIHALKDLGLLTDAEWAVLRRTAIASPKLMSRVRKGWPGLKGVELVEEAVAEMFRDWAGGAKARGAVEKALVKVRDFFVGLGEWLRGNGFTRAEDVFQRVERGEVGKRKLAPGFAAAWHADDDVTIEGKFSPAQTGTEAFRKWFGDSKVVDENGEPLVVYHGTRADLEGFSTDKIASRFPSSRGFYFTSRPGRASAYADSSANAAVGFDPGSRFAKPVADGANVMPVYLRIENPMEVVQDEAALAGAPEYFVDADRGRMVREAKAAGHDGLLFRRKLNDGFDELFAVAFRPEQIKSATGNVGTFDPTDPRIRFSPVGRNASEPDSRAVTAILDNATALTASLRDRFDPRSINQAMDRFRAALQDRFLPLLRTQQAISKKLGRKIGEIEDPYLAEELSAGRKGAKLDDLQDDHIRPLFQAMHKAKVSIDELEAYLYARHAPERNAQIARINPAFKPGEGSGMTDEEAAQIIAAAERSGKREELDELARKVDAIQAISLKERLASGLLSQAEVAAWKATYKHYVPLRGKAELDPELEAVRPRTAKGISVTGKESRRAFGRSTPAVDILAHSILQAQEAILRAETNRVARAFHDLALAAPDPEFWKVDKIDRKPVFVKSTGQVEYRPTQVLDARDKELTVTVKIGGTEHRVTMNRQNADAVRLAAAMRNLTEEQWGAVVRTLGAVNRFLSTVNTTWNPEFVITNAFRDVQTAAFNLNSSDIEGIVGRTLKDYRKALVASTKGAFGKYEGEWGKAYKEFRDNGGRVYYNRMEDIPSLQRRLKRDFADARAGTTSMKAFRGLVSTVESVNLGVENAVRLAAYKNARDAGLSPAKAASLAKNLTVNFNRRGNYGPLMNSLYLFYNASVQGSVVVLSSLRHRKVQALVGGAVLLGGLLEMLNALVSDDDDDGEKIYDKISDFDKSRNLIVMLPGGKEFIKVPLPYGYNVFYAMGRAAAEGYRGKPLGKVAANLLTTTVDAFNPIGGTESLLNLLAPTIADPVVDLSLNKDYAGRPIMPEQDQYGPKVPESQRFWASVSPASKMVTTWLNEATGGDDVRPGLVDVSPEALDHLFGVAGGAAFTFFGRNVATVGKLMDPTAEMSWNDYPFVRKVVGAKPLWYDRAMFYERTDEIEQEYSYLRSYAKQGRRDEAKDVLADKRALLTLRPAAKQMRAALSDIRKANAAAKDLYDRGAIDRAAYTARIERTKAVEEQIITRFNRMYMERVR